MCVMRIIGDIYKTEDFTETGSILIFNFCGKLPSDCSFCIH